jgi:hypothetical protein
MFLVVCVVPMLMPPPQTNYLNAQFLASFLGTLTNTKVIGVLIFSLAMCIFLDMSFLMSSLFIFPSLAPHYHLTDLSLALPFSL